MRAFNYSAIRNQKWDSEILGLIAAIYKEAGKQELYLKQRPEELEKLVEIAKIQSTEASNAIEGIITTSTRIRQLVEEKTTPKNRDEQEIAGYRDVLSIIHESFDAIPLTRNYFYSFIKLCTAICTTRWRGRQRMPRIISVPPIRMVTLRFCSCPWHPSRRQRHWIGSVRNTTR